MKMHRLLAAAAVSVLVTGSLALADPALPSFDMYDPDVVKSLTWTEGTSYYDYVCYTYDESGDPEYSYRIFASDLDMNPVLYKKEGGCYFQVDPLFVGSYESLIPYLDIACQGVSSAIRQAKLTVGALELTAEVPENSSLSVYEDSTAELLLTGIGSNQVTLIDALANSGAQPRLDLEFFDGSRASCTFYLPSDPQINPFVWLYRLLTESHYLDARGRIQESCRLLCAAAALEDRGEAVCSLEGAEWIDDLSDSVRAYPVKLEYAPDRMVNTESFYFNVLNYAGTFVDTDAAVTSFELLWYPTDENGDLVVFDDGSLTASASFEEALAPGEEKTFSVSALLPEETGYVCAAISAFTLADGQRVEVPDRDLVFVFFQAFPAESTDL